MSRASRVHGPREQVRALTLEAWDRNPVSLLGCAVLIPGMTITDVAFATPTDLRIGTRVGIAATAWLLMTLVLLVLDRFLLARLGPGWPKRSLALTSYAAAGTTRVAVVQGLAQWLSPGHELGTAAPVRVVSAVVWLSAVAVLVTSLRRSSRESARLQTELNRLDATRAVTRAELAATAEQLSTVRATVVGRIAGFQDVLDPQMGHDQLALLADQLAATVESLVRPTSHQLAAGTDLRVPGRPARPTWWAEAGEIAAAWPTAAPFQPLAVLALTAPIALAAVLFQPWQVGNLTQLLLVTVQQLVVWLAAWSLPPLIARTSLPGQIAVVALGYLVLLSVGLASNLVVSAAGGHSQAESILLTFTSAVALGGGAALDARLRSAQQEIERAHDETGWALSRAQQQLWAERRRLAIALHGQVQATLTACEFLIRRWLAEAPEADRPPAALIERIQYALAGASAIEANGGGQPVRTALAEVVSTWTGMVAVDLQLSPDAERALDEDPDGRDAAVEVTRELLLNAARHGRAERVVVSLRLWTSRVVELTVAENTGDQWRAAAPSPATPKGLGHRLLDSISLGWAARSTPTTRFTEVRLATAAAAKLADSSVAGGA